MTYDQVKEDFNFLHSISSHGDMVEIDASVFDLMENPNKKKAKELYECAINAWFQSITSSPYDSDRGISSEVLLNAEVLEIKDRYNI